MDEAAVVLLDRPGLGLHPQLVLGVQGLILEQEQGQPLELVPSLQLIVEAIPITIGITIKGVAHTIRTIKTRIRVVRTGINGLLGTMQITHGPHGAKHLGLLGNLQCKVVMFVHW